MTKYRTPQFWIPNNSTPIKTILVNWVIMRDDNGNNGWENSINFRNQVDAMFVEINNRYSNSQPKGYSLTCEPSYTHVTDTRIRFELNEIIFIDNSAFNNSCSFTSGRIMDDYVYQNYPSSRKAINHIFTQPTTAVCGPWGYYTTNNGRAFFHTQNSMWSPYWVVWGEHIDHIAHEYAHSLGLHHTYSDEYTQISHYDFLDDVFGTCPEPAMANASHPCFSNCGSGGNCPTTPSPGNVSYLLKCFFTNTYGKPMMCGGHEPTYISPKQAGRMNRTLSMINGSFLIDGKYMHQYVKEHHSGGLPFEVNANETWDFPIQFYQDVLVKSGKTLTIKCEVRMPIQGKIIVEPGANLIIDGGVLTCAWPESMWQGIEVHGDRTKSQSLTLGVQYQGKVIMKNNAIIENALEGISTIKVDGNNLDWNYTGGIIQAENSRFIDCRRAVQYLSYQNFNPSTGSPMNNLGFFKNCSFLTNGQLKEPTAFPYAFVSLYDVKGVRFLGNAFVNSASFSENLGVKGMGIVSIDAKFSVIPYCTSTLPVGGTCPTNDLMKNSFHDLSYGIHSSGGMSSLNAITVSKSDFHNNDFGIYIKTLDYCTITENNFDVGQNNSFDTYGLYIDNSTGYKVEGNNFTTTHNGTIGSYINNSQYFANSVYRNNYNKLQVGNIAAHDNFDNANYVGLKMNCDNFTNGTYDIAVLPSTNVLTDIFPFQGICTGNSAKLVRNSYSATCAGSDNQYFVDKSSGVYILHKNSIEVDREPACRSVYVLASDCSGITFDATNDCPSTLGTSLHSINANVTAIKNSITPLQALLDEGNSNYLISSIYSSLPAGDLKNILLAKSPYLSDEVLIKYLQIPHTPPYGNLKQVIIANSPVTESVKTVLEQIYLPSGVRSEIDAAQIGLSGRFNLEAQLADLKFSKDLLVSDKIRLFLNDTIISNPLDSVIAILKDENRIKIRSKLIDAYIAKKDFVNAQHEIMNLRSEPGMSEIADFKDLLITLYQSIEGCYKMKSDTYLKSKIEDWANGCDKETCKNAQALLQKVFETNYKEEVLLPNSATRSMVQQASAIDKKVWSKVFPNPAQNTVNFKIEIQENLINSMIVISDLVGRKIFTIQVEDASLPIELNVTEFTNGIYFYSVYNNNILLETEKFTIQK
jgi:hypothetical protein